MAALLSLIFVTSDSPHLSKTLSVTFELMSFGFEEGQISANIS